MVFLYLMFPIKWPGQGLSSILFWDFFFHLMIKHCFFLKKKIKFGDFFHFPIHLISLLCFFSSNLNKSKLLFRSQVDLTG